MAWCSHQAICTLFSANNIEDFFVISTDELGVREMVVGTRTAARVSDSICEVIRRSPCWAYQALRV